MRDRLAVQLQPYRLAHPHVRWTDPGSWHLTCLFLGAVDPERVGELRSLVDHAASAAQGPYQARADHGDGRLRQGEGVGWLGLSGGAGRLIGIADALAAACPGDVTRGAPPRRTRSAHLTLVRKADMTVIQALRSQALGDLSAEWTVDRIALFRSHLGRDGARYETLHQSPM